MAHTVGIIGFGKMGQIRAAALEEDGRAKILKVFDNYLPEKPRFAVAASAQEIIDDPKITIVFVCATNEVNKPFTIAALKAGKHVFCEKPPAFTAEDVKEIMEVERESNRVLMYGFNHRHHGGVLKMKQVIDSGAYGRVLWMRGRYGKSVDSDYLKTWRSDRERAGGGILLDQGIHMLDLFLHITGAPFDDVHAFVSSRYWKIPGIEDNVFAIMRNRQSGVEVSFHSTMTQWRHLFSLEVFLERGYLVLNGLKTSSGTYGVEELTIAKNRATAPASSFDTEERMVFNVDTSWAREAEHFMDAVSLGMPVLYGNSNQALDVMSLIDRIYSNDHHLSESLHENLQVVGRN
ncbi:Gfo/Idh/MocA family oxidoreductase [Rhodovarius crocodyli]|uniref:Gfo/Idh/MocA family oxidoreductase n=1 Tax=Rhodovarius crocodyli TaxID=1979269 RepID=A0A437LYU2_9PROT|nr:Gfo/Idh/MocA family oxidoreductase [Rhodovarius crocodyli]RVT90598.1 Gfo/Idh/MocA family oxidoreductase [Rhodovarius crocodyli]